MITWLGGECDEVRRRTRIGSRRRGRTGRLRRELPRVRRKATGVIRALTRENKYRNDGDGGNRRQGDTANAMLL